MWVYLRLLAASSVVWLPSMRAFAWTNAHVVEAEVEVAPEPDGRTHVAVELLLDVDGGWVEGLELPGWDAVVALDEGHAATVTTADGRTLTPQTALNTRGGIAMVFPRRVAPRKGEHRVRFAYIAESALSAHADGLRMGFTLPGWEAGLRRAVVTLRAPTGTHAVVAGDVAIAPRSLADADGARIVFERVHVPRNTPWTVLADVPARVASPQAARSDETLATRDALTGGLIALFVLAVGHAARFVRRRRHLPLAASASPLPRGVAELAVCVGAAWWPYAIDAALLSWLSASVALALLPAARDPRRTPFGRLANVSRSALSDAECAARCTAWRSVTPFDATTALGLVSIGLLLLAPTAFSGAYARDGAAWGLGLLCVVPAFFAGTRLDGRADRSRQLAQLATLARGLSVAGWAFRLAWLETVPGPSAPRLLCTPALRLTGLWSVTLLAALDTGTRPVLRVELDGAFADSVAHTWAAAVCANQRGVRGRRILDLYCDDADTLLTWLADSAAARCQTLARSFSAKSLNARVSSADRAA